MLEVYLDDSGIHDDSPYCVVAGLAAGANPWKRFDEQWKLLLEEHELDDFHAKDFFKRGGLFWKWDDEKFYGFLDRMTSIIRSLKLNVVGFAVDRAVFDSLPEGFRRFLTGAGYDLDRMKMKGTGAPSKPYFHCLSWCLYKAAQLARHSEIPIHVYCDQQTHYEPLARSLFEEWKELEGVYGGRLTSIEFASRRNHRPLQAADLVAHVLYRYTDAAWGSGTIPPEIDYVANQLCLRGLKEVRLLNEEGVPGFFQSLPIKLLDRLFGYDPNSTVSSSGSRCPEP